MIIHDNVITLIFLQNTKYSNCENMESELRSRTLEALFLMMTPGYLDVTEEDKCVLFLYLLNCEKRVLVFVSYLLQNETKNRYLKHLEFPFL